MDRGLRQEYEDASGSPDLVGNEAGVGIAAPSTSQCTPSSFAPEFECEFSAFSGGLIVHYSTVAADATEVSVALQSSDQDGWVGIGWNPDDPPAMLGATAVIATSSAANGQIGVYLIRGYSTSTVQEVPGSTTLALTGPTRRLAQEVGFEITEASVTQSDGQMTARFTRTCPGGCLATLPGQVIIAKSGSSTLQKHTLAGSAAVSFAGGAAATVDEVEDESDLIRAHAWLMVVGWWMLVPLAIIAAAGFKTFGPTWFYAHLVLNTLGLLLVLASFVLALVKFELESSSHKTLGIVTVCLGLLQPINGFLRPHKPEAGEKRSGPRLLWELGHQWIGRAALVLAAVTIFSGIDISEAYGVHADKARLNGGFAGLIAVMVAMWAVATALHWLVWRPRAASRSRRKGQSASSEAIMEPTHPADASHA